jgi:hypothetical protein
VLVGLGPGVDVEEGMGVVVGNVGLGGGRVVREGDGVGDPVGAGEEAGAWQPARIIRMMMKFAIPIQWCLVRPLCEDCIMMKYSIII